MTKSATNIFLILLALVAVAWGQVAGLHQGYACVCSGEVLTTLAEHCHVSDAGTPVQCLSKDLGHGLENKRDFAAGHLPETGSEGTPASDSDQVPPVPCSETHPHVPVTTDLKAQNKISSSLEIPVPAVLSFSDLPDFALPVVERPAEILPPDHGPPVDPGDSPPAALRVTACTVFLV